MGETILQTLVIARSKATEIASALLGLAMIILLLVFPLHAADPLKEFPNRVKRVVLSSGLRLLIVERPESPTVSFATYIRTGALDDDGGQSGLAHMFEHMLFKGTRTVGTKDYAREAPILLEMDRVMEALQGESEKKNPNPETSNKLAQEFSELEKKHAKLIEQEEFWKIFERAGAQDLNAGTGYDFTNYVVSLPVNAVPLWMVMEADRILHPVLREFYKERSVVLEERRQRVDNAPQGKLWEAFNATAFMAHPYGRPIVGWESDIARLTRKDAERFFKKHYDISRLVIAVVGGVKAEAIETDVRKHFGPIPSRFKNAASRIPVEPPQEGERRVEVEFDSEPSLLIGYHRPDMTHSDAVAIGVMEEILSSGRTSRLNRFLVEKDRVAVSAWAGSAPGERDPHLIVFGATPRAPHTNKDLEAAIYKEIRKLQAEGPTERELEKVKNNQEAALIRELSSNPGLASQLAYYEALTGDWAFVLREVEAVRAVTADQVKGVANKYLQPENRTVAFLVRRKG